MQVNKIPAFVKIVDWEIQVWKRAYKQVVPLDENGNICTIGKGTLLKLKLTAAQLTGHEGL